MQVAKVGYCSGQSDNLYHAYRPSIGLLAASITVYIRDHQWCDFQTRVGPMSLMSKF